MPTQASLRASVSGLDRTYRDNWLLLLAFAASSAGAVDLPGNVPVTAPVDRPVDQHQLGSNYSSLNQINTANVANLQLAWEFHTGEVPPQKVNDKLIAFEDQPNLIDGSLVVCTTSRRVIALDPQTGKQRWVFDPKDAKVGTQKCRGVSHWVDSQAAEGAACKSRIFFGTADYRLIAIDAKTGQRCEAFGEHGQVQMKSTKPELFAGEVVAGSKPAVVNDVVVVGSAVADNQRVEAPSGRVLAFDARTGAAAWQFDPVPRDLADPAMQDVGKRHGRQWRRQCLGDHGGRSGARSRLSPDDESFRRFLRRRTSRRQSLHIVHRCVEGFDRPGRLALSVRSSQRLRLRHAECAFADRSAAAGRQHRAGAGAEQQDGIDLHLRSRDWQAARTDRRASRAARPALCPARSCQPTQPFPEGMPTLAPQSFSPDDAWGFTFFDKWRCRSKVEELNHGPIFTPPSEKGTSLLAFGRRRPQLGRRRVRPGSHIMVVPSNRVPMIVTLIPRANR